MRVDRSANDDDHGIGIGDDGGIGRGGQPAIGEHPGEWLGRARLEERKPTGADGGYGFFVDVEHRHRCAAISEGDGERKSHVTAATDDCDVGAGTGHDGLQ